MEYRYRKPRRSFARRRRGKTTLPPQLKRINRNAAGIDIGAESHFVAVPADRDQQAVREFGAFTDDLHRLADWLQECGIKTVAMESTGSYWIPLMEILEGRGFEVQLVNTHRLKYVPGRKSDVLDCQWLQTLHTFGLLAGCFRPDDEITPLRSYMRQQATLVKDSAQHIQRMQKAMTEMNLRLHHVINDITGVTGIRIIEAILAGERDPVNLAKLRDERCKNSEETIAKALTGNWREEHLFALKQQYWLYQQCQKALLEVGERIEGELARFPDKGDGRKLKPKNRRRRTNQPAFNMQEALYRMSSFDLTVVEGVDAYTALVVISELGLDLKKHFPTENQFVSWLCFCPGTNKSGGRQKSSRTRRSSNRVAAALRMAASSLHHSHSALGAYYRRMQARLGKPQAVTATAHKIARFIYRIMTEGMQYVQREQEAYQRQFRDRALRNLQRRAKQMGFALVPVANDEHPTIASGTSQTDTINHTEHHPDGVPPL
jgi:transposase